MRKMTIKTTEDKFFRQVLELFRSLPPFNKLRSRELDILAQILYYNNKNKDIDINTRYMIVFNKETRKIMRDNLNISVATFNNNISGLKKVGLISEENRLKPYLETLYFNNEFKLEFNFKSK